jgi:antitoxin CptB
MIETDEIRRKRLLFRSWHRGTKEADLLLGSFAEENLAGFSAAELDAYEKLIEENDADLWDWLIGQGATPEGHDPVLIARLRSFRYTARSA